MTDPDLLEAIRYLDRTAYTPTRPQTMEAVQRVMDGLTSRAKRRCSQQLVGIIGRYLQSQMKIT